MIVLSPPRLEMREEPLRTEAVLLCRAASKTRKFQVFTWSTRQLPAEAAARTSYQP